MKLKDYSNETTRTIIKHLSLGSGSLIMAKEIANLCFAPNENRDELDIYKHAFLAMVISISASYEHED